MQKLILLFLVAFNFLAAQNVSVEKTERMTDENSEFYYPQFSPDGSKVLLTSANYSGLWLFDLNSNEMEKLNGYNGAGFNAQFTNDGSAVVFRADEFEGMKKYSKLLKQSLKTKEETILKKKSRNISTVNVVNNSALFLDDKQLRQVEVKENAGKLSTKAAVFIEDQKIALVDNGVKKILAPLGDGNYIWASVSPDNSKLLFNFAGRGTFVSDLNGNILNEIGYANAPQWSDDGKFIVYMKDYDNGQIVTASDIYAYSLESGEEFQLTDSEDSIEMYPVWKNNRVAFNTVDGQIYIMNLKID